jgi:hypothetical protein
LNIAIRLRRASRSRGPRVPAESHPLYEAPAPLLSLSLVVVVILGSWFAVTNDFLGRGRVSIEDVKPVPLGPSVWTLQRVDRTR